jgi:hypothetical protein
VGESSSYSGLPFWPLEERRRKPCLPVLAHAGPMPMAMMQGMHGIPVRVRCERVIVISHPRLRRHSRTTLLGLSLRLFPSDCRAAQRKEPRCACTQQPTSPAFACLRLPSPCHQRPATPTTVVYPHSSPKQANHKPPTNFGLFNPSSQNTLIHSLTLAQLPQSLG